jgi:hypothetical protein
VSDAKKYRMAHREGQEKEQEIWRSGSSEAAMVVK